MAAAWTKLVLSVASRYDSGDSAKVASAIAKLNRGHDSNECLCVECKVTSSMTTPNVRSSKGGKLSVARATARPLSSGDRPQAFPISTPGARRPGYPQSLPPNELVGTPSPQERWLRKPNELGLNRLRRSMPNTLVFACRGTRWRQWKTVLPKVFSTWFSNGFGHRIQRQFFIPFRGSHNHPRRSSGVNISTRFLLRVSRSRRGSGDTGLDSVEDKPHSDARTQYLAGELCGFQSFCGC